MSLVTVGFTVIDCQSTSVEVEQLLGLEAERKIAVAPKPLALKPSAYKKS